MRKNLRNHDLFIKLASLNLSKNDYVIFGSSPMFAHGLKDTLNDLDVLAGEKTWAIAKSYGTVEKFPEGNNVIRLLGGKIEILESWWPGQWNINELIARSEIIDTFPFASLEDVLTWKKLLRRPKDVEHILLIENYLSKPK